MAVAMHSPVQDPLQHTCAQLHRRGWPARISRVSVCGELDVRLQSCHPGRPLIVELLGPYEGVQPGDRWQAVRIDPDGRTVWCGPPRRGVRAGRDLLDFLEDLLQRDVDELVARYAA